MSQGLHYAPEAFDLYIFDKSGASIYHQYQYSNAHTTAPIKAPPLGVGKWYAVVLASDAVRYTYSRPFTIKGRIVTNGKLADGKWIVFDRGNGTEQPGYLFYVKATCRESLSISAFDIDFGGRESINNRYHIPGIHLQTNPDDKVYFSSYPSYKNFVFPKRGQFL